MARAKPEAHALVITRPPGHAILFGHERHECPKPTVPEVQPEPRDDADNDRHEKHAVVGVNMSRHGTAEIGEHEKPAKVARLRDKVESENRQLDHPERQGGSGGIGLGPLSDEALGLRDLEVAAGQEHKGEEAREHPAGHSLPFWYWVRHHLPAPRVNKLLIRFEPPGFLSVTWGNREAQTRTHKQSQWVTNLPKEDPPPKSFEELTMSYNGRVALKASARHVPRIRVPRVLYSDPVHSGMAEEAGEG